MAEVTGYSVYKPESEQRRKCNPLGDSFPKLPTQTYDIIYADPPWDYHGKMQYDRSCIKDVNVGFRRKVFISAATFQYPTMKLRDLEKLDVPSISASDCLLFLWTTGPQMANAISLGSAWGFAYKTVAFVWDKMNHNPGRYTLSQTEFCLVFKKGRIPSPRGARNVKQLVRSRREAHSAKPEEVIDGITAMFPSQRKIDLFARRRFQGWDAWGLEAPS
jgi:N6-adenosine-specific RNA methylase IME4